MRLCWNTGSTFGAAGFGLAMGLLVPMFGFHLELVPCVLAGAAAVYFTATWLDTVLARMPVVSSLIPAVLLGTGVGILSFSAGFLALGITNVVIEISDEAVRWPINIDVRSLQDAAQDYLWMPLVMVVGGGAAAALGAMYGACVYDRAAPASGHLTFRWRTTAKLRLS